jgi:NAD(P)-dependent dehydrogenase (short-subunit alcohol dehydrogenase family)
VDFTGKIALVTGASRGIGRSIATEFAKQGATVAAQYHKNVDAAHKTLALLEGQHHRLYSADQSNSQDIKSLVDRVVRDYGKVDILVNNAGIYREHIILNIPYDEWVDSWYDTISVNLMGPANLTYLVANQMAKQGGGRIINVSSRGAFRGEPDAPAYGASKAGLNALSQSLAKALAPHNIFIYVVAPGWVDTDMASQYMAGPEGESIRAQSPLNRIATADEVSRTVLFLASEGTDFLTGCIVDINGASYLRS